MKNILKKLNIVPNQGEDTQGSNSSRTSSKLSVVEALPQLQNRSEHKPFTALAGWLQNMTNRKSPSPPASSNVKKQDRIMEENLDSASSSGFDVGSVYGVKRDSESSNSKDPDIEEEYQIQLAMEMSAREDPEAVQIEAVKQISLGSCTEENTPAEVVAFRYWNYNALSYDDKILDGFYDLYGDITQYKSSKMPSLVDLQAISDSEGFSWEAIVVKRATDANLRKLEQRARTLAIKARSEPLLLGGSELVRQIAILVANYMGGAVGEPENMLRAWKSLSYSLKSTLQTMVLPLGSLTIGLARHRALLFKVLADCVDIPCRLVKGQACTGFDDVAMNIVKIDDGREFIVDLMADPGTIIPCDAVAVSHADYAESLSSISPLSRDMDSNVGTSSSEVVSSFEDRMRPTINMNTEESQTSPELTGIPKLRIEAVAPSRPAYPISHARSPSWTEGVSSPAAHKMKVKNVSQYMIDAAKENPQLAQKLHDVLLESGVAAPPNLFTEIYGEDPKNLLLTTTAKHPHQNHYSTNNSSSGSTSSSNSSSSSNNNNKNNDSKKKAHPQFLPPLPHPSKPGSGDGSGNTQVDIAPVKFRKNVPVAAAAAAAAAVVASSMVVAASKSKPDPMFELPVTAAATATAAAVVATTAVGKQYEPQQQLDSYDASISNENELRGSDKDQYASEERTSDRSAGGDSASSARSDLPLDDVADCEISWEEITLGERIGLGSYGEVYRGDWHGTEVAVKRFLDQDIYGESLEEFKSEVHIMKRLRHPNVVLFMGAVTRPPNLSIVTEFLHRGSLYRLIHRPNNQLDERRRLRMAFDAARGMNYLHNCSPVIVHRDLKSPNLLVDKNWVVKVCDFGLSRMKHSTFLSSRSTAGTAEWMAPEVLRNEPSNEKCDVYSFGVILWELCTLQQPWGGMNPMQVVGAVGFQLRRLDIPDDMDPAIADIIQKCWQTDPKQRPTFSEIMAALKPLLKPITGSQVPRPTSSRIGSYEKV